MQTFKPHSYTTRKKEKKKTPHTHGHRRCKTLFSSSSLESIVNSHSFSIFRLLFLFFSIFFCSFRSNALTSIGINLNVPLGEMFCVASCGAAFHNPHTTILFDVRVVIDKRRPHIPSSVSLNNLVTNVRTRLRFGPAFDIGAIAAGILRPANKQNIERKQQQRTPQLACELNDEMDQQNNTMKRSYFSLPLLLSLSLPIPPVYSCDAPFIAHRNGGRQQCNITHKKVIKIWVWVSMNSTSTLLISMWKRRRCRCRHHHLSNHSVLVHQIALGGCFVVVSHHWKTGRPPPPCPFRLRSATTGTENPNTQNFRADNFDWKVMKVKRFVSL